MNEAMNKFFDDVDELSGGDGFGPLPNATYLFNVAKAELREMGVHYKLNIGLVVNESDEDGYAGRWVWFDPMLDGLTKAGKSRFYNCFAGKNSAAIFIKRLLQTNPKLGNIITEIPHLDPATHEIVLYDGDFVDNDMPDLSGWQFICDAIIGCNIYATTRTVPKEEKKEDGKYGPIVPEELESKIKDLLEPNELG